MRAVVFLNAAAGSVDEDRLPREADDVAAAFRDAGVDVEVKAVAPQRLAEAVKEAAASADFEVVVVGGGDGTISTAAAAMVGSDKPFGVLPMGTLNHFSKDLGIPQDLREAARTIAAGHVHAVDVGEVNGRVFVNNSSIGLYPRAVEEREKRRWYRGWPKWPAMMHASLSVLRRFRLLLVTIRSSERVLSLATPFVFIGNNQYEMSLFSPVARSCLDRGELSLYVARTTGRWGILRLALRALLGRLDQAHDFESMCLPEVEIEAHRERVRVALDGEVVRLDSPLRYRTRPRALRVLAPAKAGGDEYGRTREIGAAAGERPEVKVAPARTQAEQPHRSVAAVEAEPNPARSGA